MLSHHRFWAERPFRLVNCYPIQEWTAASNELQQSRQQQNAERKEIFIRDNNLTTQTDVTYPFQLTAVNLASWAVTSSWTYCAVCKLLVSKPLLPGYSRASSNTVCASCLCKTGRYIVPRYHDIPICLRSLTLDDVRVLRPFDLHTGDYARQQHGYRKKKGFCRVSWSILSVQEKISCVQDPQARARCQIAYTFLMNSEASHYKHFVNLRPQYIAEGRQLNMYDRRENIGIECALWPTLYPVSSWCETALENDNTRLSGKVFYVVKALSEILDYSIDYELLQFTYDRWVFNTVSGAVSSCFHVQRSAASSLDNKAFSREYWKWQHRFLLDAIRMFGYPTLFLTISPYEWTFPNPLWLLQARSITGLGPTQMPVLETLNIVHTLEQVLRGYLCGSNTNRWYQHVFNYNNLRNRTNVQTYFYRVEFQDRGTAHIHLLVWLKDVKYIQYNLLRADVPWQNSDMAYLVTHLQSSNKDSLPVREQPTTVVQMDNQSQLQISHPADAFALNIRGYVSSLLPFLRCRMDVQTTDCKGMILRYVTSYVTKMHDSYSNDALYSRHVSPYEAAYRHIAEMSPCEPEMVVQLSSLKMSWTPHTRKRFVPPRPHHAADSAMVNKYITRPESAEQLSMLEWLRQFQTDKPSPTPYKASKALVGVKYVSVFNKSYFFQYLLLNVPFRSLSELQHPDHEQLPELLQFFAAANVHMPEVFNDDDAVAKIFRDEGHREHFVANVLHHIQNLRNTYHLWQLSVISSQDLNAPLPTAGLVNLTLQQQLVVSTLQAALRQRQVHYRSLHGTNVNNLPPARHQTDNETNEEMEHSDNEEHIDDDHNNLNDSQHRPVNANLEQSYPDDDPRNDWTRIINVEGKPGTGKTVSLHSCIRSALDNDSCVLVATPTGHLAATYKGLFGNEITAETVHSAFRYPVNPDDHPICNHFLASFDVIFLDEISMIASSIFRHILSTLQQLQRRPVLVTCGDKYQQQPIQTVGSRIQSTNNIYDDQRFHGMTNTIVLQDQHRCQDLTFANILNHIRHWPPTQSMLDVLHGDGRLLCTKQEVTDNDIIRSFQARPSSTILTVSRRCANRVSSVIISHFFNSNTSLGVFQLDNNCPPMDVYLNMKVMITRNLDKSSGVINGQMGIVKLRQRDTFVLELPSKKKVCIHPVTELIQSTDTDQPRQTFTFYPMTTGYAMTVCKSQGQTLGNVIIWFDTPRLGPGSAYVALSRVSALEKLAFLVPLQKAHFHSVH